jgi:hypothetical protein
MAVRIFRKRRLRRSNEKKLIDMNGQAFNVAVCGPVNGQNEFFKQRKLEIKLRADLIHKIEDCVEEVCFGCFMMRSNHDEEYEKSSGGNRYVMKFRAKCLANVCPEKQVMHFQTQSGTTWTVPDVLKDNPIFAEEILGKFTDEQADVNKYRDVVLRSFVNTPNHMTGNFPWGDVVKQVVTKEEIKPEPKKKYSDNKDYGSF